MNSIKCAGCPNTMKDAPYLHCVRCKNTYHVICTRHTLLEYNNMTPDIKNVWVCDLCRSKEPKKGNNTNTPVRGPAIAAQQDFVSQRSKNSSCNSLTAETIRDIIGEELRLVLAYEFNPKIKEIHDILSSLESSMLSFNTEIEKLKEQCSTQAVLIESVRADNEALRACNDLLNSRLSQLEQHSRACNVEIHGVPEHKQENLINTVHQLAKVIDCPVDEKSIHICTRIAKMDRTSPRPRSVLVKFNSPRLRDQFLAANSKFNKKFNNEKLNSSHLGVATAKKDSIYITEHLSPETKMLLAATRRKAKELKYKFVWVRDGRIFVRKTENAKYIQVRNHDTIMNLS